MLLGVPFQMIGRGMRCLMKLIHSKLLLFRSHTCGCQSDLLWAWNGTSLTISGQIYGKTSQMRPKTCLLIFNLYLNWWPNMVNPKSRDALWRRFIHFPLFTLCIVLNVSFEVCFSSPPSWECLCWEECHSNAVSSGQPLQRSSFYTITCDICRRTHIFGSSFISGTEEPWNAHWRKRTKSDPVTIFDNEIRLVTNSID